MTVYVCCNGERHEGCTPYAAYTTKDAAIARIRADAQHESDVCVAGAETDHWRQRWQLVSGNGHFSVGCNVWIVFELTVEG